MLATQNPIESEGVYPLPEAQRDRFLMKIVVDYPTAAEEREIVYRMGVEPPVANPVITHRRAAAAADTRRPGVRPPRDRRLRRAPRARHPHPAEHGMPDVAQWVSYGASPRASLGLIAAGRAIALLRGRDYVLPQDVLDVAADVLAHRMVLSYDAIADGVPAAHAVRRVLQTVPLPQVAPRQRAGGPTEPGYGQRQLLGSALRERASIAGAWGAICACATRLCDERRGVTRPRADARPRRRPRRCCAAWN